MSIFKRDKDKKNDPKKVRKMSGPCDVCGAPESEECYRGCPVYDPHNKLENP